MLPAIEFAREEGLPEALESIRRQKVPNLNEAVAIKRLAPGLRNRGGQAAPPPPGHLMGELQPRRMEAAAVELLRTENRIIDEALRAGAECQQP